MSIQDFFNRHIVFRYHEFKQFMETRKQKVTESNCHMTLYNYCKKGKLSHIRKGLYVVNSDGPYQADVSPFLIAGKATDDAVLAYHTALESHGLAYTDFNEHVYLTNRRTNPFSFQNQRYRAIYSEHLKQENVKNQSIEIINLLGIDIRRTTMERTLVDVLDRPDLSGGWEEVIRSLDMLIVFNASKAVDYALSLKRASIVAKLGYFFEERPEHLEIDPQIINRLLPYIPRRAYYIDRKAGVGKGIYIRKWQIIVPKYLHQRLWEERGYDLDI